MSSKDTDIIIGGPTGSERETLSVQIRDRATMLLIWNFTMECHVAMSDEPNPDQPEPQTLNVAPCRHH